jgi:zinc protease
MRDLAGGDPAAVAGFSRDDLVGFQQRWLRPDNLKIFVVSDLPLAELQPLLEQRFGTWAAPPRQGRQGVHRAA